MAHTGLKLFIAEGFPNGFPEEVEERLGCAARIVERDYAHEFNIQRIENALEDCGCVLIPLSAAEEINFHATVFNTFLKLYDVQRANLITLLRFEQDEIPPILRTFRCLDYNAPSFWVDLSNRLENISHLKTLLPVGNVAQGLVWNYFYGYLMKTMRDYLKMFMENVVKTYGKPVQSLEKLIILLPQSCTCKELLDEYDSNISYMIDDEVEQRKNRAGQEKIMLNAVYKIQSGDETFVLLLDVPNIMTIISKLKTCQYLSPPFTDEDVKLQYKEFRYYLREALDYQKELKNLYLIIEFDEKDPNLKLGELITERVREENAKHVVRDQTEPIYKYDVNIVAQDKEILEDDGQRGIGELAKLQERLIDDGFKVYVQQHDRMPGSHSVQARTDEIEDSRKTLLWIDSQLQEYQDVYYEAHVIQDEYQKGILLPVVKGGTELKQTKGFQYLGRCNHLINNEPDFYEKLVNAIKDDTPLTYPLGDISTGLVWAYVINYLEVNLDDFVSEYKKTLAYDTESVLYPKFICLIPETCHAPGKITSYDDTIVRMTPDYKEEIQVNKMISGKRRKFNIPINKVTARRGDATKVYKVMCEFVTPLAALADMERGMKTQLSTKHKLEQRKIFDALFQKVVQNGTEARSPLRHCAILKFKDEFDDQTQRIGAKFNLSELIADLVETDIG